MDSKRLGAVLFAVMVLALGCQSSSTTAADPCDDTGQVEMPVTEDADLLANIKFDELTEMDTDGRTVTYSDVTAHFDDFSGFNIATDVVPFGNSCVGTVGMPVSEGEIVPLNVASVTVSSSTMGEISLEKDAEGGFPPLTLDRMFSAQGGEVIQIDVASAFGPGEFPPFSASIEVPSPIEDIQEDYQGDGSLEIDWSPSDATYFEITLRSLPSQAAAGTDNRLRCFFLADDGCFIVPSDAMDWMRSNGETDFSLLVERHRLKISIVEENALLQIDTMRSVKFNIGI